MDRSVFLDTSYILTLVFKDDYFNNKANAISKLISSEKINIVTTELVIIEIGDSLAKTKIRHKSIPAINNLRSFSQISNIDIETLREAWELYEKRIDKEWGITDCYSFIVMKRLDIRQALSTDKHFEQAGFEVLLK